MARMKINVIIKKTLKEITREINGYSVNRSLKKNKAYHLKEVKTFTKRQELEALFYLAVSLPQNAKALEIGSYLGASTGYLCAGLRQINGHLICVDTWNNETMPEGVKDTFSEFVKNIEPFQDMITILRESSQYMTPKEIPYPLDFVFIDGDHTYPSANKDFCLVANSVKENGIIAFHDCKYFEGVSRTVGIALASGNWGIDGVVNNLCWIRKKRFQQ